MTGVGPGRDATARGGGWRSRAGSMGAIGVPVLIAPTLSWAPRRVRTANAAGLGLYRRVELVRPLAYRRPNEFGPTERCAGSDRSQAQQLAIADWPAECHFHRFAQQQAVQCADRPGVGEHQRVAAIAPGG